MASIAIILTGVRNAADLGISKDTGNPRGMALAVDSLLWGLANGEYSGSFDVVTSATDAARASAEVTATSSGNLGTVINGTTVTTTFATSADVTATAAVADINANTTVNKWVTATKSGTGKFLVTANIGGELGNACTLTVTGTGASATGSGKLIGGTGVNGQPSTFNLK